MFKSKFIGLLLISFVFWLFPLSTLADNAEKSSRPTVTEITEELSPYDSQDNNSNSAQNYQFVFEPKLCRQATIALKILPKNFDKETFEELLGCRYFKDKNNVYSLKRDFSTEIINNMEEILYLDTLKIINEANPKTFETLPWKCDANNISLAKDKNAVFINDKKIEGVDAKTFKSLDWCFAKDQRAVYHLRNESSEKIDGVDANSFEIISSEYAKDDENIYYFGKGFIKLEDADPVTFQFLENDKLELTAKDKKNYYYQNRKISLPLRMLARAHRFQTRTIFNSIEDFKFGPLIMLIILISIGLSFLGYLIWGIKNKTWRQNFKPWLKNMLIYAGIFLPLFTLILFPAEDSSTGGRLYEYDIEQRFELLIMGLILSVPFYLFLYLIKSRRSAILFSLLNLIILELVFFFFAFLAGIGGA